MTPLRGSFFVEYGYKKIPATDLLQYNESMSDEKLYTVDSIDETVIRLEDPAAAMVTVPRAWLPGTIQEGDAIRVHVHSEASTASVRMVIDPVATAKTYDRVRSKLNALRDRGNS